jgi:hypothetical protein
MQKLWPSGDAPPPIGRGDGTGCKGHWPRLPSCNYLGARVICGEAVVGVFSLGWFLPGLILGGFSRGPSGFPLGFSGLPPDGKLPSVVRYTRACTRQRQRGASWLSAGPTGPLPVRGGLPARVQALHMETLPSHVHVGTVYLRLS